MERTATKITITGRCLGQSDGNGWEFAEKPNVLINDRGIRNLASLLEKFEGQRVKVEITPVGTAASTSTVRASSVREGVPRRDKARGWLLVGDETLDGADLLQAFIGREIEISAEILVEGEMVELSAGPLPKADVVAVQVKPRTVRVALPKALFAPKGGAGT